MKRLLVAAATFVLALVACDRVGSSNSRGEAVPIVAPPVLSPVELIPPTVDRQVTQRVNVRNPPAIAAVQIDLFAQKSGKADILWVVDDAGLMADERARLSNNNNFGNFYNALAAAQTSFHMAVTSTDPVDQGQFRGATKIINNSTPDAGDVFAANTTFPSSRIRWTPGLRMAELALTPPNISPGGPNDGFLRPDAALAIIVVADAEDQSLGDPAHYARVFRSLKGKGNENLVTFSTIAGTTPDGCYGPGEQVYFLGLAEPAFRYQAVSAKTQGVIGSICDPSFETTLLQIAEALNTLQRIFPLSLNADPSTITVMVNGVLVPQDAVNGWQFRSDTNSIAFFGNYVPPPNATIKVQYAIHS